MPKVSIVIPTYNRSSLLKQALESCLQQTYRDFEIIVADDGSTDDTREAIESLNSDKIKYTYQSNRGRSIARNRAIKSASGEYITFLDSDDLYLPQKLEVEVRALDNNPSYDMVYSSAYNINIDGDLHPYIYQATKSGCIYKDIALYLPLTICLPTVMVRRKVFSKIGMFDERQSRFEDTDMWRRIAREFKVLAIEEPLCKIRYHEGNEMEHPSKILDALKYYTRKVLREDTLRYGLELRSLAAKLFCHYGLAVRNHANPEYKQHSYAIFREALYLAPVWFIKAGLTDYLDSGTAKAIKQCLATRYKISTLPGRLKIRTQLFKTNCYHRLIKLKKYSTEYERDSMILAMVTKRRILRSLPWTSDRERQRLHAEADSLISNCKSLKRLEPKR